MTKQLFEWDIRDDADEWDSLLAVPSQSAPIRAWSWEWRWWAIIALLLVVGGWLWFDAERGSAHIMQAEGRRAAEQVAGRVAEREQAIPDQGEALLQGVPAVFESEFFLFRYDAQDDRIIRKVAAKLNAMMPTMISTDLVASRGKWIVDVTPVEPAATHIQSIAGDSTIFVSIPTIELATSKISQDELLAQSIVLEMLDRIAVSVIAYHAADMQLGSQARAQLERILYSLRLWEIGNVDLPLAALDKPIVQWIYSDSQPGQRPLPHFAPALCTLHHMWEAAPFLVRVPLFCGDAKEIDRTQLWRYLKSSHWRLDDLSFFQMATPDQPFGDLGSVVGLATVMDYISVSYGREGIADLVVSAPHYNSWEALIPATFGVTRREFEEGWQAHLQDTYGVAPKSNP